MKGLELWLHLATFGYFFLLLFFANIETLGYFCVLLAHLDYCWLLLATFGSPDQTRSDQTRSDQTRPDKARPDQTRPDQTRPDQVLCWVEAIKHNKY